MNWILRLFSRKKVRAINAPTFQRNIKKQVDYRIKDIVSLVEYNRENIKTFCKDPVIEWGNDGKEKHERLKRRHRLESYEGFLLDKIDMLRIIRGLEDNCN